MKLRKILLIAFVIMSAQNAIAEVSGEDILIYSPDGSASVYRSGAAVSDEESYAAVPVDESRNDQKRSRSRSSSKSTSSHSSKANTSAISLPSSSKQLKNINDLSVNKLFGDKYKRNPNTKLTIIDGVEGNHFRKLEVNNSRDIMEEVLRCMESDGVYATSKVQNYTEMGDDILYTIMSDGVQISIGYKSNAEGTLGSIFMSWNDKITILY